MTAEQRAARLQREYGITDSDPDGWDRQVRDAIARAIRAAENAALERAARECLYPRFPGDWPFANRIRALKIRAPRRKK